MKDFICQDYATKNCVICTSRFRSEEASRILCYVKDVGQKGKGLFAKKKILKGTYICQYRGKEVPKGTVGNYVVQVDESTLIDAEKTIFWDGMQITLVNLTVAFERFTKNVQLSKLERPRKGKRLLPKHCSGSWQKGIYLKVVK